MLQVLLAALVVTLLGLALCFYGYRCFLVLLPILGFFAGFWLGAHAVDLVFGEGFLATVTSWVFGFLFGLFGAVLSYFFYTLGVVLVAAGFGAAVGSGLMGALGLDPGFLRGLVSIIGAVIMVGLTFLFSLQKYVIIALTAFGGANALLLAALLLIGRVEIASVQSAGTAIRPVLQDSLVWAGVWLALAVAGVWFQVRSNREYEFSREQYAQGWR